MNNHPSINRVCIVDTVYSLFLYLLYSEEKDIANSFFFFGNGIDKSIRDKFQNHYHFDKEKKINTSKIWLFFSLRLMSYVRWPFLKRSAIWAHDHLPYSPYLIGGKDYVYIEDAPYIFSIHIRRNMYKESICYWSSHRIWCKRLRNLMIGDTFMRQVANNNLCNEVLVTTDDFVPYLQGKNINKISLSDRWNQSTEQKKSLILSYFSFSEDDINVLKNKPYILFTQQFSADGYISEQEQIDIYSKIIAEYDSSKIIIKPHPRDTVKYKDYFAGIAVFDKIIPMQLINLLGVKFSKCITISSSAVLSFSYDIEIDWKGNSVHPTLYDVFGDVGYKDLSK